MKLVVFAGAGFSVPFGLPAMNSFFGFADASRKIDTEAKALIGTLILEARRANSFLESSPTNLEDVLSFSEMGDRLGLSGPGSKRSERVRAIIQRIYTTATASEQYWNQFDKVRAFLGFSSDRTPDDLTFITTNYDLNIEVACMRAGWPVSLQSPLQSPPNAGVTVTGRLYSPSGIPLYKLHGSVNWYPSPDTPGALFVEDRVVRMTGGSSLPYACVEDYRAPWPPIIIPPSFLKPELPAVLHDAWAGAARALSEATVVAFVGYSFPASDTEMSYFLARALSENSALRRILVVDPNAGEIVQRLRSPLSKTGSHFRDLIEPLSVKWQDLREPLLKHSSRAP